MKGSNMLLEKIRETMEETVYDSLLIYSTIEECITNIIKKRDNDNEKSHLFVISQALYDGLITELGAKIQYTDVTWSWGDMSQGINLQTSYGNKLIVGSSELSGIDMRVFSVKLLDTGCQHDFKTYVGFTDSFDYCTKCNEKR